ncbi:hypothetical protein FS837_002152 [Tulasnella sp. UAMH 9824]|nr:hypothetical protein FS837_002152 [Tulasnella sp. UAMH 9824]
MAGATVSHHPHHTAPIIPPIRTSVPNRTTAQVQLPSITALVSGPPTPTSGFGPSSSNNPSAALGGRFEVLGDGREFWEPTVPLLTNSPSLASSTPARLVSKPRVDAQLEPRVTHFALMDQCSMSVFQPSASSSLSLPDHRYTQASLLSAFTAPSNFTTTAPSSSSSTSLQSKHALGTHSQQATTTGFTATEQHERVPDHAFISVVSTRPPLFKAGISMPKLGRLFRISLSMVLGQDAPAGADHTFISGGVDSAAVVLSGDIDA